jgi:hypothetical protein
MPDRIRMLETNTESHSGPHVVESITAENLYKEIIRLMRLWAQQPKERWADLRSRARSRAARELVAHIRRELEDLEQKKDKRRRKRREKAGAKFSDAIERFVGDLLRAKAVTQGPALIFRSIGKSSFDRDPVKYETFNNVLEGLKELELVSHRPGQTRYRKSEFDPGEFVSTLLPGHASRFWATSKLLRLAALHGIDSDEVTAHFAPEPPTHPLVLQDHAGGNGPKKPKARRINYTHTVESRLHEADLRELNRFLARFKLTGGTHEGYIRVFNNNSWKMGGRLYSVGGPHSYQQMPESKRHKMRINDEPVSEIDIKASQLTIYHRMVDKPLDLSSDPYVRAGIDRWITKKWVVVSFGVGAPCMKWPKEAVDDYEEHRREHREETGEGLPDLPKARDVARKMLESFPALKKLDHNLELWGDLQYREATAVVGTMLLLMRTQGVPSLSMHDGIIVPKSKAELAQGMLREEFRRLIGVDPVLTVEPEESALIDATEL